MLDDVVCSLVDVRQKHPACCGDQNCWLPDERSGRLGIAFSTTAACAGLSSMYSQSRQYDRNAETWLRYVHAEPREIPPSSLPS